MYESPLLFNTLLFAVAEMRRLQQLIGPGSPLGLRMTVAASEKEVDDLVKLHLVPSKLEGTDNADSTV